MNRRRFFFWVGFGLFSLGEKLRAGGFDELAAATLKGADTDTPTHWRAASNSLWQWYERETLVEGRWTLTGITTPINRETGQPYTEQKGYLDPSLVPAEMRVKEPDEGDKDAADKTDTSLESSEHRPDPSRRARHGRPPSKWLRSLNADELSIWLKTVEVTESGVSGMTYFTHLTRDHFFDADKITGLAEYELAKLHGAAHDGY
jgi:hypothetical protein